MIATPTKTVRIVTASWFSELPDDYARIGISRGVPRNQKRPYKHYRTLQPGSWFNSVPSAEYVRLYRTEVLAGLDPERVLRDIMMLAEGRHAALLCWESAASDSFCHRGLVSAWLYERLGLAVPEIGLDPRAYGWSHPKLPPIVRRPLVDSGMATTAA
ncbi:MAG: hypothetical protein ACM31O_03895 [Bacteroidota bacterium]